MKMPVNAGTRAMPGAQTDTPTVYDDGILMN